MKRVSNESTPAIRRDDAENIALEERLFPGYLRGTLAVASREDTTSELVHAATVHAAATFRSPAAYEAFLQGVAFATEARRRAEQFPEAV